MNICIFTGYIDEDLVLLQEDGVDVNVVEFTLVCYEHRKPKNSQESVAVPTYIRCEAWHTGAEAICKMGEKGSKVTLYCSARNLDNSDDNIIFRVNRFEFADDRK